MYVALMRHGKAEPYKEGMDDSGRVLLPRGKDDAQTMASLLHSWWPGKPARIWTSPFVRACQTADILSQQLQPAVVRTDPFLGSGDLSGLYQELCTLPQDDTVLLIGHQPYLDRWAAAWTGNPVGFKTASVAFFSYDPYDGPYGKGKLLLYMHPAGARLLLGRMPVK